MLGVTVFKDRLEEVAGQVQSYLDGVFSTLPNGEIAQAMAYASAGGKRLRAFLVMESARLNGVADQQSLPVAASVELLHAYSLVHDDLPCMDDDDMRRGQPTVHVKWNEAIAVLVGDALQALAFDVLCDPLTQIEPKHVVALTRSLAQASGANGMVLGQALDIAAETANPRYGLSQVEQTQSLKTGALIEWSAAAGAIMVGKDDSALRRYAQDLGRAFQIADDILDVTGTEALAGKRVGKDANAGKATFVSLLGLDAARDHATSLIQSACDALDPFGSDAENLRAAAGFVIARQS